MEIKSFALTMGAGMVAGAVAAMMLPKQSKVRQMADSAAQTIEGAVSQTMEHLTH